MTGEATKAETTGPVSDHNAVTAEHRGHRPAGLASRTWHLLGPSAIMAAKAATERSTRQRVHRLFAHDWRRSLGSRNSNSTRALRVVRPGELAWAYVRAAQLTSPEAAIVRPIAVATCDLDRPLVLGRSPFPLPLQLGHECVAEVIRVGSDVQQLSAGDVVVVPFQISCGQCNRCLADLTGNCLRVPPLSMYGFGVGGGHWGGAIADELEVPFADAMCVPVPATVNPVAAASVADSASDGFRHVAPHLPGLLSRGGDVTVRVMSAQTPEATHSPSSALVAGLTALWIRGAAVQFVDHRYWVRSQAALLGLEALTPTAAKKQPLADLVVDVTGTGRGLRTSLLMTAPDGICSGAGGLAHSANAPIGLMYARSVQLHLGRTHVRSLIPQVLDWMTQGFQPDAVITDVQPMDRAAAEVSAHCRVDSTKLVLLRE